MAELNLRAEKVAHNVHVPTNEEHLGRYYIVAQQPEDESYEKRIKKICDDLDEAAEFLTEARTRLL